MTSNCVLKTIILNFLNSDTRKTNRCQISGEQNNKIQNNAGAKIINLVLRKQYYKKKKKNYNRTLQNVGILIDSIATSLCIQIRF